MSEIERRWQQTRLTGLSREELAAWVAVEKALQEAILDEEKAKRMYYDLIRKLDSLRAFELESPIVSIANQEGEHRVRLLNVLYEVRKVIKV